MDEIVWLHWEDLTQEEKKQARESYITIRELEEEIAHSTASKRVSDIAGKRFQRTASLLLNLAISIYLKESLSLKTFNVFLSSSGGIPRGG